MLVSVLLPSSIGGVRGGGWTGQLEKTAHSLSKELTPLDSILKGQCCTEKQTGSHKMCFLSQKMVGKNGGVPCHLAQWAFGAKMTSCRRRCDVITSYRR